MLIDGIILWSLDWVSDVVEILLSRNFVADTHISTAKKVMRANGTSRLAILTILDFREGFVEDIAILYSIYSTY